MRIRSIKRIVKSRIKRFFISEADQDLLIKYKQNSCVPPGHFYSPIVNTEIIKAKEKYIWPENAIDPAEIDLNVVQQVELLYEFKKYYFKFPYLVPAKKELRYCLVNTYFDPLDAISLYSIIRHFCPKKVIEVGSGFSSAIMLDTNELFNNNSISLTFIEPYPDRLLTLLRSNDQKISNIIEKEIQEVPLEIFKSLKRNDLLFIDSTHVCKTGSDLNHLFFKILPVLNSGVIVHFHDIFGSFEYPRQWVFGGRNWNEIYLLRAFLMCNSSFKILFFNDYLFNNYHKKLIDAFPFPNLTTGGSIYLIKN